MYETKASEPEDSRSKSGEVWNRNPLVISHDDKFNGAPTIYQNTDLASNFVREFTKEAGKLRRENLLRRDFPSVDMFDSSDLIRL